MNSEMEVGHQKTSQNVHPERLMERSASYQTIQISVTKEGGLKGFLGLAYLDLRLLHKSNGKADETRECISKAMEVFEQCDAEYSRKKASGALAFPG